MTRVGIGITTYNRSSNLRDTLTGVFATSAPDVVVVADDGSEDDTASVMRDFPSVAYLQNPNGGIARNKNRLLFRLFAIERCDVVILLEDDTKPVLKGWLEEWFRAGLLYGSVSCGGEFTTGKGTAISPFTCREVTAQSWAISRKAWQKIGYLDHRFKSYGYEHVEWQRRASNAGYGKSGTGYLCLSSRWFSVDSNVASTGTPDKIAASFKVLRSTLGETGYKPPCEDWNIFLNECLTASEKADI